MLHDDDGYLLCFQKLRKTKDYWLVNEHIPHVFSFSSRELDYLEGRYRKRINLLRELFPWDDPNYGIDEQWAVFYPYAATLRPGQTANLSVRLTNHSAVQRTIRVTPRGKGAMSLVKPDVSLVVKLDPRRQAAVEFEVRAPSKRGTYLVTADVQSTGMHFRDWVEALIVVE